MRFYSRTPSFRIHNNWVLVHCLLDTLFEPRTERGRRHSLNRDGSPDIDPESAYA